MSGDPAIAAAQRAWDARYVGRMVSAVESAAHDGLGALAIAAAREALAPLRAKHKLLTDALKFMPDSEAAVLTAALDMFAEALYSSSELEGDSDAQ